MTDKKTPVTPSKGTANDGFNKGAEPKSNSDKGQRSGSTSEREIIPPTKK